jgi:DNA mismatch repair protein MutS2
MVNFFIMDEKSLITLEFPKVLEQLAAYAAFSASQELARLLRPAPDLEEALRRQQLTREARLLISVSSDASVGGASDIRPLIDLAGRMGVLSPQELLQVKNTLIVLRSLSRFFEHNSAQFPLLAELAVFMPPPAGLVDAISHAISERGDVTDDASPQLASIRRELKVSHERLMSKLEHLVNDPRSGPMLQEAIITQRNGRYVVPLRAEFKGRLRSIVHDQSASGATLFVEPVAVVELNNRWHEMQLAERDEIRRILADLSGQVGRNAAEIIQAVISLAEYDLALSCAKYAEDMHASEPILIAMDDARIANGVKKHPGSSIRLFQGRHPLLDQNKVVPIDIDLDKDTYAIVITGPNTGGKTVTLKTVGLLALMAQAGLHIPAQSGSTFSFFENIFADIGDEQSIEQSLSTFSAHINNIVRILNQADPRALILLDELAPERILRKGQHWRAPS